MRFHGTSFAASILSCCLVGGASADTVKMECQNSSSGQNYCKWVKERFESTTQHKLETITLPPASDEKLALFQQIFAAKDGGAVDVFQADTIWMGLLDKHLLDLTDQVKDLRPFFFKSAWDNDTVNGRQKGVPAFLDAGGMYYREDLLRKYGEQPPMTWDDLARIAAKIQKGEREAGNKNFQGFVFQGKSYEGLTCDALEWIDSYNGGTVVDPDGTITINNPEAAKALDRAAKWIDTIAPKGVLGYMEEESRAVFQNGDAAFMRNWPYAYVLAQDPSSPIKDKIAVIPNPRGDDGHSSAALGGWQWVINAYTPHAEAALELLKLLTSAESQKTQFKIQGNAPSRIDVYNDSEIRSVAPYLAQFKEIFNAAVPRPATATKAQFPKVSKAVFNAAYDVLSGRTDGTRAVADLEEKLKRIKGAEWR